MLWIVTVCLSLCSAQCESAENYYFEDETTCEVFSDLLEKNGRGVVKFSTCSKGFKI